MLALDSWVFLSFFLLYKFSIAFGHIHKSAAPRSCWSFVNWDTTSRLHIRTIYLYIFGFCVNYCIRLSLSHKKYTATVVLLTYQEGCVGSLCLLNLLFIKVIPVLKVPVAMSHCFICMSNWGFSKHFMEMSSGQAKGYHWLCSVSLAGR